MAGSKRQVKSSYMITEKQIDLQCTSDIKTNYKGNLNTLITVSISDSGVLVIPVRMTPSKHYVTRLWETFPRLPQYYNCIYVQSMYFKDKHIAF
jgi:hypothetical protein